MGMGLTEILVVCLTLVLFFGAKRLPGLVRGIRTSVTSFRSEIREEPSDTNDSSASDASNDKSSV